LLAATDQGVWKTTNDGDTWTQLFYPGFEVTALSLDLTDIMLAGTRGKGVYKSTDEGITWSLSNAGLLGFHIRSIVINELNHIFLGTFDYGVFMATDFGASWSHINYGLGNWAVNSLSIDKNGYLYASTNSGIYKSISSTTSVIDNFDSPNKFSLFQNYPNPFNPTTTIRFFIPFVETGSERSFGHALSLHTTLKIFDLLGREIATLVNETKFPGTYEISFDATKLFPKGSILTSGVYYYQLRSGDFAETKKMVLIR
jgi:hypothetical protein